LHAVVLLLIICTASKAETVIDNLGPANFNTAASGELVGGAIQIGATPITISTVEFHQYFTGGYVFRPGETFSIYSRNADGTVGSPLFSNFTLTANNSSFTTTAAANAPFVLQANTGYWLILGVPPGVEFVLWNYTPSSTYTSGLGVTIPAARASFYREDGKDNYFALAEGPQELRITGSAAMAPAPQPHHVVSRKSHGAAGTFDVPLPLTGAIGVECRSGGAGMDHQIVFSFSTPVTFQNAVLTSGTGTVASATISPQTETHVTVNLTGVVNAQRLTITLSGVSDGAGTGDVAVQLGVLAGDTTGNGSVGSSDIGETKLQAGQAVNGSNFRADVTANGSITASDLGLVKSQSGASLPAAREGLLSRGETR
jgi:hypothetical protein